MLLNFLQKWLGKLGYHLIYLLFKVLQYILLHKSQPPTPLCQLLKPCLHFPVKIGLTVFHQHDILL